MGQNSMVCELPFSQIIPSNITMCIISMTAFNGDYARNGIYFSHANLAHVDITVNGSSAYNLHSEFPHNYSNLYFSTLESLGVESDHTLTYDVFGNGRTICVFNFVSEEIDNAHPVAKSGNLRVNLTLKQPVQENMIVLFFANTTGVIYIDKFRHARCLVRA